MEQRVDDYLPRWVMLKDFFMKGKVRDSRQRTVVPLVQKKNVERLLNYGRCSGPLNVS